MAMQRASQEEWNKLQTGVIDDLLAQIQTIRRRLDLDEVKVENLPSSVTGRLISENGQKLSVIVPSQDMDSIVNLSSFIESVRSLAPTATGRPVIEWGVGTLVVNSFQTALLLSACSILLILLLALRNLLSALVVLVPLLLAALLPLV